MDGSGGIQQGSGIGFDEIQNESHGAGVDDGYDGDLSKEEFVTGLVELGFTEQDALDVWVNNFGEEHDYVTRAEFDNSMVTEDLGGADPLPTTSLSSEAIMDLITALEALLEELEADTAGADAGMDTSPSEDSDDFEVDDTSADGTTTDGAPKVSGGEGSSDTGDAPEDDDDGFFKEEEST